MKNTWFAGTLACYDKPRKKDDLPIQYWNNVSSKDAQSMVNKKHMPNVIWVYTPKEVFMEKDWK